MLPFCRWTKVGSVEHEAYIPSLLRLFNNKRVVSANERRTARAPGRSRTLLAPRDACATQSTHSLVGAKLEVIGGLRLAGHVQQHFTDLSLDCRSDNGWLAGLNGSVAPQGPRHRPRAGQTVDQVNDQAPLLGSGPTAILGARRPFSSDGLLH